MCIGYCSLGALKGGTKYSLAVICKVYCFNSYQFSWTNTFLSLHVQFLQALIYLLLLLLSWTLLLILEPGFYGSRRPGRLQVFLGMKDQQMTWGMTLSWEGPIGAPLGYNFNYELIPQQQPGKCFFPYVWAFSTVFTVEC